MSKNADAPLAIKLLFPAILVALTTTACSRSEPSAKVASAASEPKPIPVKLQSLQSGQIQDISEFVGRLEAQQRVRLQPEIQGRIVSIPVASGAKVKQGEPIVLLNPEQTQAQLNSAMAATNKAKAAQKTARSELQAAQADRVRDSANVELEKVQFERAKKLVAGGVQSKEQLDVARRDLNTAIATLRATKDREEAAKASLSEADASIKEAEANTASVRETFRFKQVVRQQPVKLGAIQGQSYQVLDGVKPGDRIALTQLLNLKDGTPIQPES
jgi:multidrug efflux pump subunit AcrA (membrane-fusion protein)